TWRCLPGGGTRSRCSRPGSPGARYTRGPDMSSQSRALFVLTLSTVLGFTMISGGPAASAGAAKRWYKGNTHTHSLWSDGDGAPEHIADWYKSHGYQILELSDHNILKDGEKWR